MHALELESCTNLYHLKLQGVQHVRFMTSLVSHPSHHVAGKANSKTDTTKWFVIIGHVSVSWLFQAASVRVVALFVHHGSTVLGGNNRCYQCQA